MTRVYVDMVADLFHHGHVAFLRVARGLGDTLVVGIHSDETVASYKGPPVLTMAERIAVVESCRYVDEVVADAPLQVTEAWLAEHDIDLVVHGDDMDNETLERLYGAPRRLGVFQTIPYTPGISTSEILARIARRLHGGGGSLRRD
jgi:cytidyltransferase-like protein